MTLFNMLTLSNYVYKENIMPLECSYHMSITHLFIYYHALIKSLTIVNKLIKAIIPTLS